MSVSPKTKKPIFAVIFSEEGHVNGDGRGAYVSGLDNLQIEVYGNFFIMLFSNETSRYVYVRFGDMLWRGANLRPLESQLPSGSYYFAMAIYLHDTSFRTMDINLPYEPSIWFVTVNIELNESYGVIRSPVEISGVGFLTLRSIPATPPPQLYNDGYISLTRVSENRWILEGDAWFLLLNENSEYYIKLKIAIQVFALE